MVSKERLSKVTSLEDTLQQVIHPGAPLLVLFMSAIAIISHCSSSHTRIKLFFYRNALIITMKLMVDPNTIIKKILGEWGGGGGVEQ